MAIITSKTFNGIQLLKVNSNPSGISAPNGSIALDTSTANKYRNVGGDVWNLIVSGSITEPQASGTQGPQGAQGGDGVQGYQGSTGDRGPQGVPGSQGNQGSGTQGAQGSTGDRGTQGDQGLQGFQGTTGSGTQGAQGAQGDRGERGQGAGSQGAQGYQGSTGVGTQGPQGVPGSQGATGSGTQGSQGYQGPQGVPGSGGGGASGGLPVINVTTDLVGLGYAANAVTGSGVSSGGDAIQDAIDHFLLNPASFYAIYIPPGVYNISKSLIIAYPPLGSAEAGTFSQCNIISSLNMFPDVGGAKIQWNSGLGKVDPMLVIQGARNVSLSGITFEGPNTAPIELLSVDPAVGAWDNYQRLFSTDYADWISSGIRDNARSPQCCVAIDPFLDGSPGGNMSNRYPNLTNYYVGKYQRSSSNIVFEHCAFRKSAFGVAISPPGPPTASGDNVTANAENFYFKNCFFEYNRVHYSTGQSQARANNLFSPRMFGSWISIDTQLIGPGTNEGGTNGVAPVISGAPNIGGCKYVLNINTLAQPFDLSNAYCESIASIGRVDFGVNGTGARFSSCNFSFKDATDAGIAGNKGTVPGVPFHLSNMGMLHMDRCLLNTGQYPLKIWNGDSSRLKFTQCAIQTPGFNNKVQIGFDKYSVADDQKIVRTDSIIVVPVTGNVAQDSPETTKWTTYTIGSVTFTEGANPSKGSFTVNWNAPVGAPLSSKLEVGDLVYLTSGTGNFKPEIFNPPATTGGDLWGTVGTIESISGDGSTRTIAVKYIHKGFPFGAEVNLNGFRWSA